MSDKVMEINNKISSLKSFFAEEDLTVSTNNVKSVLEKFLELKSVMGNIHGNIHFLARYLAYLYLKEKYGIEIDLDTPEGRCGLDIEESNIVGEIKTTIPYLAKDFGAKQKEGVERDLSRLEKLKVRKKIFFVIHEKTEQILRAKYEKKYPSVEIINLLKVDL